MKVLYTGRDALRLLMMASTLALISAALGFALSALNFVRKSSVLSTECPRPTEKAYVYFEPSSIRVE